jgi:molybdenum cofactor cytidylyltransferase
MHAVAILLAAGDSERMGTAKALLDWGGRPLLSHQIEALQESVVAECLVVLGREAERLLPWVRPPVVQPPAALPAARSGWKARPVINPRHAEGRSASIRAGLAALTGSPAAVLIAGVDQPLGAGLIDALIEAAAAEGWGTAAPGRPIIVPACRGRRGHPPLFSATLLPELREVREETEGLKAVIRREPGRVREMPWDDEAILLNLNTPVDLRQAQGGGSGQRRA